MANFEKTLSINNLGDSTINIPTTDIYSFIGSLTLPNIVPSSVQGPGGGAGTGSNSGPEVPSQVVVTIKQNGSTKFTTQAGAMGFQYSGLACTAGDVITFTLSSSLAQDKQPNSVRLTLAISEGSL